MRYEIWGETMPALTVTLDRGEGIYTQSGGMSWMSANVRMETNTRGGFLRGLGRSLSGNSIFMATYTALYDGEQVTIASTMPGHIKVFEIGPGREIIAQKGAFLCATPQVDVRSDVAAGLGGGLFGGEGFILQRFCGTGLVFCEMDGCVREYDLLPGQTMKVNTGNVAAFEPSCRYSVERVRGFKNFLFGGEGLFLTTLTGPGKIWLLTMTVAQLANRIVPYVPSSGN